MRQARPLPQVYAEYLAAFNDADLGAVARHLTDDVVFDWGEVMPPLIGRHAFVDFYAEAWRHFEETITASDISADETALTAWIDGCVFFKGVNLF